MNASAPTPTEIVQTWLDDVSDMFFRDDFDGFAAAVCLPIVMTTRGCRAVLTTRADIRLGFDAWARMIRGNRATHLIRTARVVQRIAPDRITASYDTELLRNGTRIVPTFSSWMMLCQQEARWKLEMLISGMANSRYPFSDIKVDPNCSTPDRDQIPHPPADMH